MEDYMDLLNKLSGPKPILLLTAEIDRENDWPEEIPYGIDNIVKLEDGPYRIGRNALTTPKPKTYSGYPIYEFNMRFLENFQEIESAKEEYEQANPEDTIGVVLHLIDLTGNPEVTLE